MSGMITAAERDAALFMSLEGVATSAEAKELVASLGEGFDGRWRTGPPQLPINSRLAALGAIVCDLIRNARSDHLQYSHRPIGVDAFTGKNVGYRPFTWAFGKLREHEHIDVALGHQQWASLDNHPSSPRVKTWRSATRLRATAWLIKRAVECGVTPENWQDHFEIVPNPAPNVVVEPLQLRGPSSGRGRQKHKGLSLPIDLTDPIAKSLRDRVARLNSYIADQTIEGAPSVAFYRLFNEGGATGFNWDKGGRLYVANGGGYQIMKKAGRKALTINGEPVIELDVTASHLGILHALRGEAFDPSIDPYDVPGIPRSVAKAWVTMTLGHNNYHVRWPPEVSKRMKEELGRPLGKVYPLIATKEVMLRHLPVMRGWCESGVRWPQLQYNESQVIISAVETLAFSHDVASLPVHDSIIVPAIHKDLASGIIKNSYKAAFGYEPMLKES